MKYFMTIGVFLITPFTFKAQNQKNSLKFNPKNYTTESAIVNNKEVKFRAYKNIVYVSKPVDIKYQTINIYIPNEYFNGKKINGYSSSSAPIFFPNNVGGYMPAEAGLAGKDKRTGKDNAILVALSKGYVVASPGARGRTLKDENGKFTGKAPAAIVDLKAAVRYLKFNDKIMPGNAEKIISNGTSAGGALSLLLGATGNHKDYEPYLKEIGAAKAKDDIFAVSAYCPITNLDNADMAYEWQFNGVNDYKTMSVTMLDYRVERKLIPGTLTENQIQLSNELKPLFTPYINQLKLRDSNDNILTLDTNGEGSFKKWVEMHILKSAQQQLDKGKDLSSYSWLIIKEGKAVDMNFIEYVKNSGRQKTPPAFDGVDLSSGENQLFGSESIDKQHFTEFSQIKNKIENASRADEKIVKMMNPMYYIGNKDIQSSKFWRLRHGTNDRDTSLAIPIIFATKLKNLDKSVDFELPWEQGHGGDYDLEELFLWIDTICKN